MLRAMGWLICAWTNLLDLEKTAMQALTLQGVMILLQPTIGW